MINLTTANKIGYLNPKTGNYIWVPVIEIINAEQIRLHDKRNNYTYVEKVADLKRYSNTGSIDFKDNRPLIKIK